MCTFQEMQLTFCDDILYRIGYKILGTSLLYQRYLYAKAAENESELCESRINKCIFVEIVEITTAVRISVICIYF